MRTTVTAVIVATSGQWLHTTLEALAAQTVQPNRVIGVINGKDDRLAEQFRAFGVDQIVATGKRVSFGTAINFAERLLPLPAADPHLSASTPTAAPSLTTPVTPGSPTQTAGSDAPAHHAAAHSSSPVTPDDMVNEWLWLLTEDAAPEPKALRQLLSSVLPAASVAAAGPKLIDWDQPERIIELGQGLTRGGNRWLLRRQELDQQQYDDLEDTLGVGPTAMLVRRSVWRQLEGFDPALPVYDDALDFCVRARLSGHRVVVAPRARVRAAMSGIAGPPLTRKPRQLRKNHTQARIAHLHRRIAYAPALLAPLLWLLLPLLGLLRMGWALLREQPENLLGELVAALTVFAKPLALLQSRRRVARSNVTGWGVIRPLRITPKTVRTALLIDKEAILIAQGRARKELQFINTGGLTTVLLSTLLSVALTWWLYGQDALTGGGSARLSKLTELWAHTRISEGLPADPFTWVLATLGSITFFDPSLALVLFLALAIPLATLGGWLWAAHLTESAAARAFGAFAWALSPVLLGSIDQARIQTVVLAVVLPWAVMAATRAHETWAWAGTSSLLAAVVLAAAPALLPFAALLLLLSCVTHPRDIFRLISVAIAPAALFFPLAAHAFVNRDLWALLRDPGITSAAQPATLRQLLLGFPTVDLEGWAYWFSVFNTPLTPTMLLAALTAPLLLLALFGAFTARPQLVLHAALLSAGGMATAIFCAHTALTVAGSESIYLWPGSGLAPYWLGLVTLATCGVAKLGKLRPAALTAALLGCCLAVAPLLVNLASGSSEARHHTVQVPALVAAAGASNPDLQTLKITALAPATIRTQVITGAGTTLDELRTASFTIAQTPQDRAVAEVVGALFSPGSLGVAEQLAAAGISYVLLDSSGDDAARATLQAMLEEQGALESAGVTAAGHIWRAPAVNQEAIKAAQQQFAAARTGGADLVYVNLAQLPLTAQMVWIVQLTLLAAVLLLALPTAKVAEQPRRRGNRGRTQRHVTDTTAGGILRQRTARKQRLARRQQQRGRAATQKEFSDAR